MTFCAIDHSPTPHRFRWSAGTSVRFAGNRSEPTRKRRRKSTSNPLSSWGQNGAFSRHVLIAFRHASGTRSGWHPWKPLPYSPIGTRDRVPDGYRNPAAEGAVERLRNGLENLPPKRCRNGGRMVGWRWCRSPAGNSSRYVRGTLAGSGFPPFRNPPGMPSESCRDTCSGMLSNTLPKTLPKGVVF